MSRPPIKAMAAIKNYCEKTQCRRCVFGYKYNDNLVACRLLESTPCDWEVADKESNE